LFTHVEGVVTSVGAIAAPADPYSVAEFFTERANAGNVLVQSGADFYLEVRETLSNEIAHGRFKFRRCLDPDHAHHGYPRPHLPSQQDIPGQVRNLAEEIVKREVRRYRSAA